MVSDAQVEAARIAFLNRLEEMPNAPSFEDELDALLRAALEAAERAAPLDAAGYRAGQERMRERAQEAALKARSTITGMDWDQGCMAAADRIAALSIEDA